MYNNVGSKIQVIGKVIGWIELIAGVIVWLYLCVINGSADELLAWIYLVAGVVGYICSSFIYAFGQIVNDIHAIREKAENFTQD